MPQRRAGADRAGGRRETEAGRTMPRQHGTKPDSIRTIISRNHTLNPPVRRPQIPPDYRTRQPVRHRAAAAASAGAFTVGLLPPENNTTWDRRRPRPVQRQEQQCITDGGTHTPTLR